LNSYYRKVPLIVKKIRPRGKYSLLPR